MLFAVLMCASAIALTGVKQQLVLLRINEMPLIPTLLATA